MRKKIALCLALAMSLSMTACKATPTNAPSVETSESTTEKTYTAKNLSDEEFYKLRVLAPDGNTPDNPERYGEYGLLQFFSSVTPENYNEIKKVTGYPTTYKNHAVPSARSFNLMKTYETGGGTYLAYDGSECPYTAFRFLTVEEFQNPENWDFSYHAKEDPYASKEENAMNMTLKEKGDYIDGYDAAEYVKKEWTDNYEAFLKVQFTRDYTG